MVELEGIEPSAGIRVTGDRHAIVSPTRETGQRLLPHRNRRWPFVFIGPATIYQK